MTGPRKMALAVVAAGLAGTVVAVAVRGNASTSTTTAAPPLGTATVARTDLATTVLTEGILGYAPSLPVVNRLSGTYTSLAATGSTMSAGHVLYGVDNTPVVLMAGLTPAWRPFVQGMADGPDVYELEQNLMALGDAHGLFSGASDTFTSATTTAVERWQTSQGQTADGQIGLGQVAFLPGPVLVGAPSVSPGQPAAPGESPFQVTTAVRTVTVPLDPSLPPVTVGEMVSITMPTGSVVPGTITAVGPPPPGYNSSQSQGNGNNSSGSGQGQVSTVATVTPTDPSATGTSSGLPVQVSLTSQSVSQVLAAPINALLALAGGGYGLEIVGPGGTHHLVGVTTGIFTGSQVEVSGAGIDAGIKVVVAQ